jgi:hypothetical protein
MAVLTRSPGSTDLLQSTKFRVTFDYLPGMTFFCQSANFPGLSLTEIPIPTPFIDFFVPGEKLVYDTLNITFLIDEQMLSWTEIHDWIRGLTFPTDFKEYFDLQKRGTSQLTRVPPVQKQKFQYGGAILSVYSNQNNPKFRVRFNDVFPTSLSSIIFNTQDTAENIAVADATFRFSYYDYERIT